MKIFIQALFVFTLYLNPIYSQKCGTEQRHQWLLKSNSEYKKKFDEFQLQVNKTDTSTKTYQRRQTLNIIPVVVHVIHLGEPVGIGSNISNRQIQEAIRGLNEHFRNANGFGVDMEIEFCLASIDPNGIPTTGINRVDGSGVPDYTSKGIELDFFSGGADAVAVKSLSVWPHKEYYNIWMVHRINGNARGYANYPINYIYEGTVINAGSMPSVFSVLTHELGHAFGLRHTYEGDGDGLWCPADTNCTLNGDLVCDTPPHKISDCDTFNPCTAIGIWDNSNKNFLSACGVRDRFTEGQKDRVQASLLVSPRLDLISSQGCSSTVNCATVNCDDNELCTFDLCINDICLHDMSPWVNRKAFGGGARLGTVGFSIGSKGYIGTGGVNSQDFWEYDPDIDSWTQKADFPGVARQSAVGFAIGNKGYLGTGNSGGTYLNDFWEYDPSINSWTRKADFGGTPRIDAVGFKIENIGIGYIGLGRGPGLKKDFWRYQPTTDIWQQVADFGGSARQSATGFSIGIKGYVGMGYDGSFPNDLWEYNPVSNIWIQKSALPTFTFSATGLTIGVKGYVLTDLDFWSYDPISDEWNAEMDLPVIQRGAVGFSINDKGYIATGVQDGIATDDLWEFSASCGPCQTPLIPDTIIGNSKPCIGSRESYTLNQLPGYTYIWGIPTDWTFLSGQGTSNISVVIGSTLGSIVVNASNACFTSNSTEFLVIPTTPPCSVSTGEIEITSNVEIYPNPSIGGFTIHLRNTAAKIIELNVLDLWGRVIYSIEPVQFIEGDYRINIKPELASGIYWLKFNVDGKFESKKIIVI